MMLLKGVNKRVIVIKNPESEIFEEAYFIVKNRSIFSQAKENEMVAEANRIISDYSRQQKISAGETKARSDKTEKKAAGAPGFNNLKNSLKSDFSDLEDDFFDDEKFFAGSSFGGLDEEPYSGFKLVASKKISKLRLPRLKAPPKSFFVGVGLMSALVIAARIFEFALSR